MNAVVTITKSEALSVGLDRYYPGTACAAGHVGEVYCVNDQCCECNAGKLTPAQFAYLFGELSTSMSAKAQAAQTWQEWESVWNQHEIERMRAEAVRVEQKRDFGPQRRCTFYSRKATTRLNYRQRERLKRQQLSAATPAG